MMRERIRRGGIRAGVLLLVSPTGAHELLPVIALQGLLARLFIARLHLFLLNRFRAPGRLRGETFLHKRLPFVALSFTQSLLVRFFAARSHLVLLAGGFAGYGGQGDGGHKA
jgi:hypothetical protein